MIQDCRDYRYKEGLLRASSMLELNALSHRFSPIEISINFRISDALKRAAQALREEANHG